MPSGICINFATPERNEKKMEMEIQNRKKSERNFHNEHVHNHLALSPWSIWLHATRRRVSRIIPIVLRPKRGCKIFIISCPLPGQMQCKAISRFSIFHFVSFHFFLLFSFFLANILTLIMMRSSLSLRVWLYQVSLGKRLWCVLNWGVFSVPPFPPSPV